MVSNVARVDDIAFLILLIVLLIHPVSYYFLFLSFLFIDHTDNSLGNSVQNDNRCVHSICQNRKCYKFQLCIQLVQVWMKRSYQMIRLLWSSLSVCVKIFLLSTRHDVLNRELANNITCQWVCNWSTLFVFLKTWWPETVPLFQTFQRKSGWEDLKLDFFILFTND